MLFIFYLKDLFFSFLSNNIYHHSHINTFHTVPSIGLEHGGENQKATPMKSYGQREEIRDKRRVMKNLWMQ